MRRLESDVMTMSKGSRRRARAAFLLAGWMLLGAGAAGSRAASWPPPLAAAGAASPPPQGAAAAPATPIQEGLASIRGVLFRSDETTRIKGATVTAINTRTGRRYVSNYTGENGAYEVKDLPAGTYDIAIDSSDRLYVTDSLVDLAEKQRLYLSFSLQAKGAAAPGAAPGAEPGVEPGGATGVEPDSAAGKGHAKVTFTDPNAVPATQEPPKKKGFWHSAGGIAIITVLVGGAFAAGISAQHN
jgi:hypothetical protein